MRCAVVVPVPVPYREPLFERLHARGRVEPHVVYLSAGQPGWDQPGDWFPDSHPYPARALRSRQRARPGRSPVTLPGGLGRALAELDPDCVVSWEFGPPTWRALAWCRRRGRPLVIFSEVTAASARALSPLQRRIHRAVALRAAGFVAASTAARRRVLELGVPGDGVEVSLQSADVDAFRLADVDRSTRDAPCRLLAVGRLVADKNHSRLLRALARSGLGGKETELVVCGTGPLEATLRRTAEELAVPARFPGYVPPAELRPLFAEADAFVLVSTYEPFGAAVREAAAAGLPIVCSRIAGAVGDLALEEENALLVDPEDEDAIAAALRRLVNDRALRERLAAGSRAVTARTPLDRDVEAFERAVERAASR